MTRKYDRMWSSNCTDVMSICWNACGPRCFNVHWNYTSIKQALNNCKDLPRVAAVSTGRFPKILKQILILKSSLSMKVFCTIFLNLCYQWFTFCVSLIIAFVKNNQSKKRKAYRRSAFQSEDMVNHISDGHSYYKRAFISFWKLPESLLTWVRWADCC